MRHVHRFLTFVVAGIFLLPTSCSKKPQAGQADVVARLCAHVSQNRKKVIVDVNEAGIWSDGAILEVGGNFPPALQELISRPTMQRDIRSFVTRVDSGKSPEWQDAMAVPSPRGERFAGIKSADGKMTATVEAIYVEYLRQRYPGALLRIKGEFDPVLFVVGGELRASVMPFKSE